MNILQNIKNALNPQATTAPVVAAKDPINSSAAPVTPSPLLDPHWLSESDPSVRAQHNRAVKQAWKTFVATHEPTAPQLLLRAILLNKPLGHGFTPLTNPNRLRAGHRPHQALEWALNALWNAHPNDFAPFVNAQHIQASLPRRQQVFGNEATAKAWEAWLVQASKTVHQWPAANPPAQGAP